MKKSGFIYAIIAFLPVTALAASAFDGTWKVSLSHIQLSTKPEVLAVEGGNFTCSTCAPGYTVKADGTDQKVTGHDFDTVAVTVTPTGFTMLTKLKGKTLSNVRSVLSTDGNSLEADGTFEGGAQPVQVKYTSKRASPATPGANPLSGSWVRSKIQSVSDSGTIETLGMTDDGFTSSSNGQSYDAKFDGKQYPVAGDPTHGTVMLKKISATEVVETDYSHGKPEERFTMTVSADGKTLHITDTELLTGRVTRYTADKQP